MRNEIERLVNREVLHNVSYLVQELMRDEKYFEDLSGLLGQEDEYGDVQEVFEYWLVTPWLGEKLETHGELVTEFCDLVIWGRQTTGQSICLDSVIEDIIQDIGSIAKATLI